jgi:ankyrin repeat protein
MVRPLTIKICSIAVITCFSVPLFADAGEDLMQAIYKNNLQGVKSALDKGVDPNTASDKVGNTPLMAASYKGNIAIMKLLIEKGGKIEDTSGYMSQTPLMNAAESGNLEAVRLLLEKGAKIKTRSFDGKTVLMFAATGGNPAMVKFFADKGLDINDRDKSGWTALMLAAEANRPEAVNSLISLKADLNITSTAKFSRSTREYSADFYPGDTALTIARVTGRTQVAKILEAAGARSYSEELFNRKELYQKLGSYSVEMKAVSKGDFREITDNLKKGFVTDPQKDRKIKAIDALSYSDGSWFAVKITYGKKPPAKSFIMSIQDAKGKNILKTMDSYVVTLRSGSTIVKYIEVVLLQTVEPVTKKQISGNRSPVTLTATLFGTSKKNLRIYTEGK